MERERESVREVVGNRTKQERRWITEIDATNLKQNIKTNHKNSILEYKYQEIYAKIEVRVTVYRQL